MARHKHLYDTARWQRLRAQQLASHPLCRFDADLGRVVVATVVDHVVAHRGDEALFWDEANLQSLCKRCHDAHKQAQEAHPDGLLRGAALTGAPLDQAHPWHAGGEGGSKSLQPEAARPVPTNRAQHREMGRGGFA